jgi:hypothetical protein
MIRKFLMIGAATAMPLGFLAATGGIAGAKALPINVSTDHVTCTTVTGSAKFSPALQLSGSSSETTSIKLDLSGCTISGPVATPGVTVTGKGAGTLDSATNNALALEGTNAVTGSITIKWKAVGGKLSLATSTVTPTSLTGAAQSDGYASFALDSGSASVSGDFAGTDSGSTSNLYVETVQTTAALTTEISAGPPPKDKPAKGIKEIGLTGGNPGETTPTQLTLS